MYHFACFSLNFACIFSHFPDGGLCKGCGAIMRYDLLDARTYIVFLLRTKCFRECYLPFL